MGRDGRQHPRPVPPRGRAVPREDHPAARGRGCAADHRHALALDTRKPVPNATIDIWQADHAGRYDNDDPSHPPKPDVFTHRARILTDEQGRYEYETIHPGAYRIGPQTWRPPHIHDLVRVPGYRTLITQLYFRGDPHQNDDAFIKPSLIIDLAEQETERGTYRTGVFDIVLPREA